MSETKDLSNEKEATLYEMFNYLCSKIDFGRSALDGKSIRCMNRLFIELRKQEDKIPID